MTFTAPLEQSCKKTTMKADVYWAERVKVNLIRKKVVRPTFNGRKLCIEQI